ncbi:hypothetical protein OsI_11603 [Oryza sativa Indica Group]|uniref:Uncharacterized protein n=1 Tax=Oryza sativa subsp. indica TaxID=39946 RepID=B8APS9_ORYSI|nr:hypothetical protein OsI_11603 [Oryza sativa Indica Group]
MPSCVTVSLMASSFLARQHANATDSRSSGPPRKTAAIWVPTFWSPWFLAAVVSSLVDILVGNWKLAPPLQNGRSVKMLTVHGASSSTLWLSLQQWCSRAPCRTRVLRHAECNAPGYVTPGPGLRAYVAAWSTLAAEPEGREGRKGGVVSAAYAPAS